MEHGRIVLSGTPKEVFTHVDLLKRMQLDVPPVVELAALLHKENKQIAADLMTIEEMVTFGSKPAVGSSNTKYFGCIANTPAIATLRF